jgi:mRNA interferase HigB
MRIISFRKLREFFERPGHADAEEPLRTWNAVTTAAAWTNPVDVKADFGTADILKASRVIFNIGGNKYRLVAHVRYDLQRVYVRFIGTHAEYDRIDPNTI